MEMTYRKRLTDILERGARDTLSRAWADAEPAEEFAPLPGGDYIARIIRGELTTARTGTPCYKLTFRVLEGEHEGRLFWQDVWLTPASVPMAKRDLAKLGITSLDELDEPLPRGIRCRVRLALRRDDGGHERNRVKSFTVLGTDNVEADPFAPVEPCAVPPSTPPTDSAVLPEEQAGEQASIEQRRADRTEQIVAGVRERVSGLRRTGITRHLPQGEETVPEAQTAASTTPEADEKPEEKP